MSAPTYPPVLREAIAADASSGFITNPIPESPTGTNAASIEGGFPPVTMTSELAGGEPPLGQDMNGFLFLLSSHSVYLQSGLPYLFDADVATALGGYPLGAILGMSNGEGTWLNITANNSNDPDASTDGNGWIPNTDYGASGIGSLSGGTRTLLASEWRRKFIVLSGTLSSNLTIVFPNTQLEWLIINNTTGAFTTTCVGSAGGGVVIPQGGASAPTGIYNIGDGQIYPSVAPLNLPISQGADPLTIAQRTNAGYLLATYFNASNPQENTPINEIITSDGSGGSDYFRKSSVAWFQSQLAVGGFAGQVLNGQVPLSAVIQYVANILASAALTGTPTAPTAALGTATSQVASTAFVNPGSGSTANGQYRKNPDGTIDQWGIISKTASTVGTSVTFPIAFPNNIENIQLTTENTSGTVVGYSQDITNGSITLSGFKITGATFGSSPPDGSINVHWRVIGK